MPKQDCATFCLIIRLVNSDTFYVNSVQSSTTLFYSQKHNIFCYNPVMVSVMSNVQKSSIYITWILLLQLLFLQIIAALVLLPFNKTRVNVQPHNHIQSLAFKTWDTNFISLNLHSYDAENRSRPSKQIWGQLCSIQTNIRESFTPTLSFLQSKRVPTINLEYMPYLQNVRSVIKSLGLCI